MRRSLAWGACRPRGLMLALLALSVAPFVAPMPAPAQTAEPAPRVRPWVPPGFDSLTTWAVGARAAFRNQPRDGIDSVTIVPYNRAGAIAFRWLHSLGKAGTSQAKAVEVALDSLGFDTEVVTDPVLPGFTLVVVRNPFRSSASAMGFMYWYRGDRLMQQGVVLRGGLEPQMRVWWNADRDSPYEWAILDRQRGPESPLRFILFRLQASGMLWRAKQFESNAPDLGDAHTASFDDLNGDGLPEIVTWSEAPRDSLFETCTGCPRRLIERIYTRRNDEGFVLHDSRLVPAPYAIFTLFIRQLVDHNRAAAEQLLEQPAMVDEAIRLGWSTQRAPGTWKLERSEDERWPRWLQLRFRGPRGAEQYTVRFTKKDGRWLIQDWKPAANSTPGAGRK